MRSVSDLDLERFLVDDLDPDERDRVAKAIAVDDELQAFVARRRLAQRQWQAQAAPWVTPFVTSRWRAWLLGLRHEFSFGSLASAVAALVLVLVGVRGNNTDQHDEAATVRARGVGDVVVAVQRHGHVFRYTQQPLRAGDAIRLGGAPPGAYATVIAVDVHGVASVVVQEAVVDADGWLAGSLVLDNSEGPERFVIATSSSRNIDTERLVQLVHEAATSMTDLVQLRIESLPAATGVQQLQLVSFEKEIGP